jgi:hypothetical protein
MKRINFYLTDQEIIRLQELSQITGLPVSELVRRAIDLFLKKSGKDIPILSQDK